MLGVLDGPGDPVHPLPGTIFSNTSQRERESEREQKWLGENRGRDKRRESVFIVLILVAKYSSLSQGCNQAGTISMVYGATAGAVEQGFTERRCRTNVGPGACRLCLEVPTGGTGLSLCSTSSFSHSSLKCLMRQFLQETGSSPAVETVPEADTVTDASHTCHASALPAARYRILSSPLSYCSFPLSLGYTVATTLGKTTEKTPENTYILRL